MTHHTDRAPPNDRSAFSGYRLPPEVIMLAVLRYLRYRLSYRSAGPCRRSVGSRWFVDETYVKVAGKCRYVYRSIDQHGQMIDVSVSQRRNIDAARSFFARALEAHDEPGEVITDLAQALETVIEELVPDAFHNTELHSNNRVKCDHSRLKGSL